MKLVDRRDLEEAQLQPQATDLEQQVVGACLIDKRSRIEVLDFLRPESFYTPAHGLIWAAMLALHRLGMGVDRGSVAHHLNDRGELEEAGGAVYLHQLEMKLPSTANVDFNSKIIAQKHMLREVIRISSNSIKAAYGDEDCFDVLEAMRKGHDEALMYTQPRTLSYADEGIDKLVDGDRPGYMHFSMPELREKALCYSGLIHTVAGRTGMGKSIFSTEQAWAWTDTGYVLMFSPEMNKRQVQSRILARESGVAYSRILAGQMSEEDITHVIEARQRCDARIKRLIIDETGGVTPAQIRAKLDRSMAEHQIQAVVIDHLHEMKSGFDKIDNAPSSQPRISYCISELSVIAKQSDMPFLVMAQLNREVEKRGNRRPTISDILWSGDVEQKSAFVGLLYREGYYSTEQPIEDQLELTIAKYRDGGVGTCKAKIALALSRIGEIEYSRPAPHPDNFTEPVDEF